MGSRNLTQQTLSFVTDKSLLQWTLVRLQLPEYVLRLALPEMHGRDLSDCPEQRPFAIGSLSAEFQVSGQKTVLPSSVDVRLEVSDRSAEEAAVALRYVFMYDGGDNPACMASIAVGRVPVYESTVTQDGTLLMSGVWQGGTLLARAERYIPEESCVPSPTDAEDEVLERTISGLSTPMRIAASQPSA